MPTATATFDVVQWDEEPYEEDRPGPVLSRTTVRKVFSGDLEGESVAELLMSQKDPDDLTAGAGFVAQELVEGVLDGRSGTFVLQHGGLMGGDGPPRTFGAIVPGSATGELEGLTGAAEISVDAEGVHRLTVEYDLGAGG